MGHMIHMIQAYIKTNMIKQLICFSHIHVFFGFFFIVNKTYTLQQKKLCMVKIGYIFSAMADNSLE
jgi:hypothetical protein